MDRINLKKVKDTGEILRDSAQFIRQNSIPVFKLSIVYVIVPIVIGSLLSLYIGIEQVNTSTTPFAMVSAHSPFMILLSAVSNLLIAIASIIFFIICIAYMRTYANGEELITAEMVIGEIKKHLFTTLFGGLIIAFLVTIGFLLCLIPGVYLSVVFVHLFVIAVVENKGFGDSFSKSFDIIKGKWWDSFSLFFITAIINIAITFIFLFPMYLIMGLNLFQRSYSFPVSHSINWLMPLDILATLVVSFVFTTVVVMNYYSLVEEKEGVGEREEIDGIGE